MRPVQALVEALGHSFADITLLEEALTHTSGAKPGGADNERLEFLGDRVLALLAAEMLIARFPDLEEGGLAPRLNAMVRGETCAIVARAAGLGPHIRLSPSEAGSGGRDKAGILADACEAVIGAIYLDGGLDAARRFVCDHWQPMMADLATAPRDAKTALQEWTQGRGLGTPAYELVVRSGPDHAPSFRVRAAVRIEGRDAAAEGEGASKRAAEQAAAENLLIAEKVWQAD
jgi:ribonuclease-3